MVLLNITLDFHGMIVVISQRIENLSKSQARIGFNDLIWSLAQTSALDHRPDRDRCASDCRLTSMHVRTAEDVWMIGRIGT